MKKCKGLFIALLLFYACNTVSDQHKEASEGTTTGHTAGPLQPSDTLHLKALDTWITQKIDAGDTVMLGDSIEKFNTTAGLSHQKYFIGRSWVLQALWFQKQGLFEREKACLLKAQEVYASADLKEELASNCRRLAWLYRRMGDNDSVMFYSEKSLAIEKQRGDTIAMGYAMRFLATQCINEGDHERASKLLHNARTIAENYDNPRLLSRTDEILGYLYFLQDDLEQALQHYRWSYRSALKAGDQENRGLAMMRLGDVYMDMQQYDSSRFWLDSGLYLNERVGTLWQIAAVLNSLGSLHERQGQFEPAAPYWERSLEIRRKIGNPVEIVLALTNLSFLDHSRGEYKAAIQKATEALTLSERVRFERGIRESTLRLFMAYKGMGDHKKALAMHERHVALRDSVLREENQRELLRNEYQHSYEKQALSDSLAFASVLRIKKEEAERNRLLRNSFMGGFAVVLIFAGVFFFQRNRISKEKRRSEELLLNILPEEVAEELKSKGESDARQIEQVTVLFTDFKGFTALSEVVTPKELVADLHQCFSAFDRICDHYGIEKIKTIGDAYMAAGGLPSPNSTHPQDVVNAALEMAEVIEKEKREKMAAGMPYFEIRIGMHTGPVVAGIVGVKKFQYDIWGDTVNTASRMESSGEAGKVNISGATYALVKDKFLCSYRGKVQAKGKGEMDMYFVEGKI